jgi:aminoglycoside/choline kinase family phosphotransferase/dTDP-glucose pyrophosphorylase
MKALILAAGRGTRLLPHTRSLPKPLFTIAGTPVLALAIRGLVAAGIREIRVNCHHLGEQVAAFLAASSWPVPVEAVQEKDLLGTGGAIRNLKGFWDNEPFVVINSDIYSDIDPATVIAFHRQHEDPVTLAVRDCPRFNTVSVDGSGVIRSFSARGGGWTFTGIQVLDPLVLDYIPPDSFFSSIDAFRRMRRDGHALRALPVEQGYWHDIGTPQGYRDAQVEALTRQLPDCGHAPPLTTPLAGDGSDRRWSRIQRGGAGAVMVEHGIDVGRDLSEAGAMIRIGRHLSDRGLPVPKILAADEMSGIILFEDLGDRRLQDRVRVLADDEERCRLYRQVIDVWIRFGIRAAEGFDPAWCWQTPAYDRDLILQAECRYFVDAFLNGYHNLAVDAADYRVAFDHLADKAMALGVAGLLHRDFQSRNIMIAGDRIAVIDFQGARPGPLQYDLAALVNDPYADLPFRLRRELVAFAVGRLAAEHGIDADRFVAGYRYLGVCRALQALGAFGFLIVQKQKTFFRPYIEPAVRTLSALLDDLDDPALDDLRRLAYRIPS